MSAKLLAACALKQWGARIFGFQNSALSVPCAHDLSTMQRKPLVPFTAVLYPSRPSTITSAPSEMEPGAALRASAISDCSSDIRYCSSGAMLGYLVFPSCARIRQGIPKIRIEVKIKVAAALSLVSILLLTERPCPILVIAPMPKIG